MTVSVDGLVTAPEWTAQFAAPSARLKTFASIVPSDEALQADVGSGFSRPSTGSGRPELVEGRIAVPRASTDPIGNNASAMMISVTRTSTARILMRQFGSILSDHLLTALLRDVGPPDTEPRRFLYFSAASGA